LYLCPSRIMPDDCNEPMYLTLSPKQTIRMNNKSISLHNIAMPLCLLGKFVDKHKKSSISFRCCYYGQGIDKCKSMKNLWNWLRKSGNFDILTIFVWLWFFGSLPLDNNKMKWLKWVLSTIMIYRLQSTLRLQTPKQLWFYGQNVGRWLRQLELTEWSNKTK
jgi:hypothetical protein